MKSTVLYDSEYIIMLSEAMIGRIARLREIQNAQYFEHYKETFKNSWRFRFKQLFGAAMPTDAELKKKLARYTQSSSHIFYEYPSSASSHYEYMARNYLVACKEAQIANKTMPWSQINIPVDEFTSFHNHHKYLAERLNEENTKNG